MEFKNITLGTLKWLIGVASDGSDKRMLLSDAIPVSGTQLIGKLVGTLNLNTTADQIINLVGGTKFGLADTLVLGTSAGILNASGLQFWTGPNRSGIQLGVADVSQLTSITKYIGLLGGGTGVTLYGQTEMVTDKIYASLTTPEGSILTASIYIYGYSLP